MHLNHLMAHMPVHAQRAMAEEARGADMGRRIAENCCFQEWVPNHADAELGVLEMNAD